MDVLRWLVMKIGAAWIVFRWSSFKQPAEVSIQGWILLTFSLLVNCLPTKENQSYTSFSLKHSLSLTMKVRRQCVTDWAGSALTRAAAPLLAWVTPPRPAHQSGSGSGGDSNARPGDLEGEHAELLADAGQHGLLEVAQLAAPPRPLRLELLPGPQQLLPPPPHLGKRRKC